MEIGEWIDLKDNMEAGSAGCVPKQMWECEDKREVKGEVQKSVTDNQVLLTEMGTQKGEQILAPFSG